MSIESSSSLSLKSFFSDRKKSERTDTLNSLSNYIHLCNRKDVNFVMLWGASNKSHVSDADKDCLLYLHHFLKKTERAFDVKTSLTIIFTDTHAYLNGYDKINYNKYIDEISIEATQYDFRYGLSSLLCSEAIKENGYNGYVQFIDTIVNNAEELFESINLIEKKANAINNFYRYALRHCNRIGNHGNGVFFRSQEDAAKGYLYFAFFEKKIIAQKFSSSAFITYMSREEEFALPELPIIRLFSIQSGLRTRPWFIET